MVRRLTGNSEATPQQSLMVLIDEALAISVTARRHRKSLSASNFYAEKISLLRAEAVNLFGTLRLGSVGDTSTMGLLQRIFAADVSARDRSAAARDVKYNLRTVWAGIPMSDPDTEDAGVFPLAKLIQTNRSYLTAVGRQINGCYARGWHDACAVMMRRLLESSIIEAFESRKLDGKIKNSSNGDFVQLTELIARALAEGTWNLPRNVRNDLTKLRDLGHRSAHNRYYLATKSDIDRHIETYREAVEAFLHIAQLL